MAIEDADGNTVSMSEVYYFKYNDELEVITTEVSLENIAPGEYRYVPYIMVYGDISKRYIDSCWFKVTEPVIKGICQMPYTGEGGGYLIGIETYKNENYTYEMLILDCSLLREGKDAWIYTTGQCYAPGNCLWTVWQPQYGYYWTLFRVYDSTGNLLEEQCYGFVNAY